MSGISRPPSRLPRRRGILRHLLLQGASVLAAAAGCAGLPAAPAPDRPLLIADSRIDAAARGAARELLARGLTTLDQDSVRYFLEREGVSDVSVYSVFYTGHAHDPDPDPFETLSRAEASRRGFTRMGTGAASSGGKKAVCAILSRQDLEMDPLPRMGDPGSAIVIRGRMAAPARPVEFILLSPSGAIHTGQMERIGREFSAYAILPPDTGRVTLEIIVEDERGPRPAILHSLYAGVPAPDAPPAPRIHEGGYPRSLRDGEETALRLVNRDRKKHGLAPLAPLPLLGDSARRHSDAMRRAGILAHILPGEPQAVDRARARGIAFVSISENIALAPSVEAAEESLLMSPAHRANILDPGATHVGVGLSLGRGPGGPDLYLTQNFIAAPVRRDPDAADAVVFHAVNAERAGRGWGALERDDGACAAAREHSAGMRRRAALASAGILDQIKKRGIQYTRVEATVLHAPSLDGLQGLGGEMEAARTVGIGVLQDRDGTYWITVIYLAPLETRR